MPVAKCSFEITLPAVTNSISTNVEEPSYNTGPTMQ